MSEACRFVIRDPAPCWVAIEFLKRFCDAEHLKRIENIGDYASQRYDGALWALPHLVTVDGRPATQDDVSVLEIDDLAERILNALHINELLDRVIVRAADNPEEPDETETKKN